MLKKVPQIVKSIVMHGTILPEGWFYTEVGQYSEKSAVYVELEPHFFSIPYQDLTSCINMMCTVFTPIDRGGWEQHCQVWKIKKLHIDGLVQDCSICSAFSDGDTAVFHKTTDLKVRSYGTFCLHII